jgi:hypothetical protein
MEVINQKEYLIEEIPAKNAGEWQGIKSNHWKGSLRIIRPQSTGILFDGIYNLSLDGVIIPKLARRHFVHQPTEEHIYKPRIKIYPEISSKLSNEAKYF